MSAVFLHGMYQKEAQTETPHSGILSFSKSWYKKKICSLYMYLFSVIYSWNECHLIDEFYHIKFLKTTTKVDTKAFLKTLRNNISKKHRQKSRQKYLPVVAESHLFSHTAWVCLVLFVAPCLALVQMEIPLRYSFFIICDNYIDLIQVVCFSYMYMYHHNQIVLLTCRGERRLFWNVNELKVGIEIAL